MSDICKTVKIKSTHPESQGDFVEIDAEDFDDAIHTLYADPLDHDGNGKKGGSKPKGKEKPDAANGLTQTEIEADLTAMGVEFDPTASVDDLLVLRDEARAA